MWKERESSNKKTDQNACVWELHFMKYIYICTKRVKRWIESPTYCVGSAEGKSKNGHKAKNIYNDSRYTILINTFTYLNTILIKFLSLEFSNSCGHLVNVNSIKILTFYSTPDANFPNKHFYEQNKKEETKKNRKFRPKLYTCMSRWSISISIKKISHNC